MLKKCLFQTMAIGINLVMNLWQKRSERLSGRNGSSAGLRIKKKSILPSGYEIEQMT
jgi:hypothetical protein